MKKRNTGRGIGESTKTTPSVLSEALEKTLAPAFDMVYNQTKETQKDEKTMRTEAEKKAQAKYDAANVIKLTVKINRRTDADIIPIVENCKEKGQLVKAALRLYLKEKTK